MRGLSKWRSNPKNRYIFLSIFLCLIFTNAWSKGKQIFRLDLSDEESYAESYTLSARLDSGAYLLLQAMIMNGGIGDEKPGCRILYVPHQGTGINEVNRDGDWVQSKPDGKLRLSSCVLKQTSQGAY